MDRRQFTKSTLSSTAALLTSSIYKCSHQKSLPQSTLPNNWIWLRPNLEWSEDMWKDTFDMLVNIGIEAILPQVYNSHWTLFDHPFLSVKKRWLESIIPIAHQAGLEVHAWMWTMPLNDPDMIEKHPDWFSVNRLGQPTHTHPAYVNYYKFLCPCHPEVQEFIATNVAALGKIEDLDGIHLDYVRQADVILAEGLQPKYDIIQDKEYPEYDYPYSDNCRQLFKEETGLDPMDLGDEAPSHNAWRQFRYDAVSHIVNNYAVPQARKYGKKITAAVFPNWESVRQQWQVWNLDGFLPMLYHGFYNENIQWIGNQINKNKALIDAKQEIYAGLFIPHLKPAEMKTAYDTSIKNGAKGISLFELGNLKKDFQIQIKQILNP